MQSSPIIAPIFFNFLYSPSISNVLSPEILEKLLEIIDTCIRSAEYIKRVVNNARELAEIGAIDMLLKKENLFEIIDELIKKYDVVFKSSNIKVENIRQFNEYLEYKERAPIIPKVKTILAEWDNTVSQLNAKLTEIAKKFTF